MTSCSGAVTGDDAPVERRFGGAAESLLASLPSPTHKRSFLAAVEAVLLGQSGICLSGDSEHGRAAFLDQLEAVVPATQVVMVRLDRAASPKDLQITQTAAWARCPRLAHVLVVVSDADVLRRDTLDQLNMIAGDLLLVRRRGLQLLLAGHSRLIDRLRFDRHENLLRYVETRLTLPALTPDVQRQEAAVPVTRSAAGRGASRAAATPNLARTRRWCPAWITKTSVAAAFALLAVLGLTLAIRTTAPERDTVVAAPERLASMDAPQSAIVPSATMADTHSVPVDPALPSAASLPSQRPSALDGTSPEPEPASARETAATSPNAEDTLAPTPSAPDRASSAFDQMPAVPPLIPAAPDAAPTEFASVPPALDPAPRPASVNPAPQRTLAPGRRPELGRSAGPGLLLVAERGDTLPGLYRRVYAGVSPPSFAAVLAVNRDPVQPGIRLLFPTPPGGWSVRPSGVGHHHGSAQTH